MSDPDQSSVRSSDGTEIAFVRVGRGPSLVIVHGSLVSGESWMPVAEILADDFSCFVMDRRAHGRSGDSSSYAIEREYDDIRAVLGKAGPQSSLLSHSYGATCALGVALQIPLSHLILYEPPLPINGSVSGGALSDYRTSIEIGNYDLAVEIGLSKFANVTPQQIHALRRSALWPKIVALAPTWTREVEAIDHLEPNLAIYRDLKTPTLLLTGTLSAKYPLQDTVLALSRVLPNCTVSRLEAQGHNAHSIAPKLVAERVRAFLLN